MKEENGDQGVGATAFDMPNSLNPGKHHHYYYGDQHVPRPNNAAAMRCEPAKIMRQVLDAK